MKQYDPWQTYTTKNGFNADEIISGLQKSIRRAEEDVAVTIAYEMYSTSEELENKLWKRLIVISVEDIGFGDLHAPVLIQTLHNFSQKFAYDAVDRPLFFVHAIRYLCSCEKDRSSDMLKNIVEQEYKQGHVAEIKDYMLDMHTRRGQELGRGIDHFYNEASKVIPEKKGAHKDYLQRLLNLLQSADCN